MSFNSTVLNHLTPFEWGILTLPSLPHTHSLKLIVYSETALGHWHEIFNKTLTTKKAPPVWEGLFLTEDPASHETLDYTVGFFFMRQATKPNNPELINTTLAGSGTVLASAPAMLTRLTLTASYAPRYRSE